MAKLHKSGNLKSMSLTQIRAFTTKDNDILIEEIGKIVDKYLTRYCTVISISHTTELKAIIRNTTSRVALETKEKPGNTLAYKNEPTELQLFSYEQLKNSASLHHGIYRGKLYGTIKLSTCNTKANCPDCDGSGTCFCCKGEKQVTCNVCGGNYSCISCNGTGVYTCTNCNGDGICPDCYEGWYTCDSCGGDGTESCPDCNGTGNYLDTQCNKCGGSGFDYQHNKTCRACHGTGHYIVKCRNCDGEGTVDCDNCDGEGGWRCKVCNGTGNCSHCHGKGGFTCKACHGTSKCGKCRGKGAIWCPDCHGKGKCFNCKGDKLVTCPRCEGKGNFQTYTQYSLTEEEKTRVLSTLPIEDTCIQDLTGDTCFNGLVYEYFAKKAITNNLKEASDSVTQGHSATIIKWLSLEANSTFSLSNLNDDYLHTMVEIIKIPVTKITLKCNSTNFRVWVVGNQKTVFHDELPDFWDGIFGGIGKFLGL